MRLLAIAVLLMAASPVPSRTWVGVWSYDLCHEDRKPTHDKDSFCREGEDRIMVAADTAGRYDITLCPADPWGERDVTVDEAGRRLTFRSRDGLDVRLVLAPDGARYRGVFRSTDGHSGRIWGRRLKGCR